VKNADVNMPQTEGSLADVWSSPICRLDFQKQEVKTYEIIFPLPVRQKKIETYCQVAFI
jgi:hypothetical protein